MPKRKLPEPISEEVKAYIGLDLSFTSPAMAIYNDKHLRVFAFAKRKSDKNMHVEKVVTDNPLVEKVTIVCWDTVAHESNQERYAQITDAILSAITFDSKQVRVNIEDYAFAAGGAHSYKLQELGGVVKQALYSRDIAFRTVSPGTWKKQFTGNGHATKVATHHACLKHGLPNLLDVFNVSVCKDKISLPSPVDDMYDAIGLTGVFVAK